MWRLGCLIWEVFNGSLPRAAALRNPGKVSVQPRVLHLARPFFLATHHHSFSDVEPSSIDPQITGDPLL